MLLINYIPVESHFISSINMSKKYIETLDTNDNYLSIKAKLNETHLTGNYREHAFDECDII